MAEKRMFAKKIIDSDAFLEMPLSAQALYFHLNMRADDDGFVNNPRRITEYVNASQDDLKILIMKRFVLCFDSGVIVIKHWRIHNTLKSDRYHPTDYQEEFAKLWIKENKAYTDDPAKIPQSEIPSLPEVEKPDVQEEPYLPEPDADLPSKEDKKANGSGPGKSGRKKKDDLFSEFASGNEDLLRALRDFEKMRKEIGKPMSDRAKSMLLKKLQSFHVYEWIPILEQSIFHDWQGIFPLRDGAPTTPRGQPQVSKGASALDALRGLHSQYEDEE